MRIFLCFFDFFMIGRLRFDFESEHIIGILFITYESQFDNHLQMVVDVLDSICAFIA